MSSLPEGSPYLPLDYPATQTGTLAVVGPAFGILGWVTIPVVFGVVAVIAGVLARMEIRSSDGRYTGDGLAVAGILLGSANIALPILCIVCYFGFWTVISVWVYFVQHAVSVLPAMS